MISIKCNFRFFSTNISFLKKQVVLNSSSPVLNQKVLKINSIQNDFQNTYSLKKDLKSSLNFLASSSLGISIRLRSNNIFSTLWSIRTGKTLYINSSGINKISFSKKKLFYVVKKNLEIFFKNIKKYIKKINLLFYNISASNKIRKFILYKLPTKRMMPIINIEYCKAFNGCKARKCRRKKRLGFRNFK